MRFSTPDEGAPPVFGWIATGDRAIGLLLAWGGCTVAPISIGAVSVGFLSLGSLGVGVISVGTVAVGSLAIGCASMGMTTYAWLSALGWETAQSGGFSLARIAAEGPVAFAAHANDPLARQILADPNFEQNHLPLLMAITLLSLIPIICYSRAVRKRLGHRAKTGQNRGN